MDTNNEKVELVLGILGGMGTYATIYVFEQYAKIFKAKKEWDRPRLIIDNRCTMPSRVRAFLYNENVDQLVNEMTDSLEKLVENGCNKIILACNTSHLFLPKIINRCPQLDGKIMNIVTNCIETIVRDKKKSVFLLGSEGTIESRIYQDSLEENGIKCIIPNPDEYPLIRRCIEAVKQDRYDSEIESIFIKLLTNKESCILGCTELPILYSKYHDKINCDNVYDPIHLILQNIREEQYDD